MAVEELIGFNSTLSIKKSIGDVREGPQSQNIAYTVKYSRLSLSRIPRDSLKRFELSVPRHISVAEVRKTIN